MKSGARYHPSREQLDIAAEFAASLERLLPVSRLHDCHDETDEVWSMLDELGLFSVSLCEESGGSGLGAAEEALLAIAIGRRLVAPSVIAAMGAAHAVGSQRDLAQLRGERVAAGYRRDGRVVKVDDPKAAFLLVRGEQEAALYGPNVPSRSLDNRLWLADLHEVSSLGAPLAVFHDSSMLRLRLLDAAALTGIADFALEMAVAYAGMREQFGRPIGSFQAIKHHCANMAVAARRARDQVSYAAIAVDDCRCEAQLQVECALLTAGTSALENAALNIQIHGGIGFSDEADPHLLLKRAQVYLAIAGGLEAANERIAAINATEELYPGAGENEGASCSDHGGRKRHRACLRPQIG